MRWLHLGGAGPVGMGPGLYTFEHTGAGAGVAAPTDAYLFGMDVTLPE